MDEARAIAQVRDGNSDAFAEVVEQYQAPIIRYLFRLTGDRDVAEDLAQDTFLQAYRSILKTTSELSLKAWLYRIATNNARQLHRRNRLLSFIPFLGSEGANVRSTEDSPEQIDEKIMVQDALTGVPAEQRACLLLHFVEELRYWEIAAVVGISEEAVRKRVARGSEAFRTRYTGLAGGER